MKVQKKLGVGIIGAGGVGAGGCIAAKESPIMQLVAIAEVNDNRRREISEKFNVRGYKDYKELLKREDIDLIFNGTPNFVHAEVAVESLKAGKHIFSEKPMGLSKKEISAMLKAEKESGKYLQIDFEMRYSKMSRRIKELIDEGMLGEVKNIYFLHAPGGEGFVKKKGDWRAIPSNVGGYYIEEGCHRIDLFRHWMNEEIVEVESIPAPELKGKDGWHRGYREPAVTLCFFPGEKLATLITLQHSGAGVIEIQGTEPLLGHEYTTSVMGSEGSLKADFWAKNIKIFNFKGPGGKAMLERIESYEGIPLGKLHHDSAGFFEDFARRVIEGEKPFMSAYDSWKSMAVVFACEKSFRERKRIKVDYSLPE